jgi:hypothetical protein
VEGRFHQGWSMVDREGGPLLTRPCVQEP